MMTYAFQREIHTTQITFAKIPTFAMRSQMESSSKISLCSENFYNL